MSCNLQAPEAARVKNSEPSNAGNIDATSTISTPTFSDSSAEEKKLVFFDPFMKDQELVLGKRAHLLGFRV